MNTGVRLLITTSRTGPPRQAGFSFLETAAVLVVAGVLVALAARPLTGLYHGIKLKGASDGVKQVLLNARMRAMANPDRQCGVVFRFTPDAPGDDSIFAFLDQAPDKLYTKGVDSLYLRPMVLMGRDGVTASIPEGFPSVIVFRGNGSANVSAKVVLRRKGMIDTVDVLASTGRIKVVRK